MAKPHASDIRMTYEYIRATYGWYTSTYEWHTDDIQVHTNDIRVHTSDIGVTYEYIQVTYGWHTSTYEWHTDDIRLHTSDIRMTYKYIRLKCDKNIVLGGCKWFLATNSIPTLFIKIFLSSATGFGNLNNLKGGPYYIF